MPIIGADYHPAFQQIAFVDSETREVPEQRLEHPEAAEKFYRDHLGLVQGKAIVLPSEWMEQR